MSIGRGPRTVISTPEFTVLHALKVKGFAAAGAIAAFGGLGAELDGLLGDLEVGQLIRFREGAVTGWSLTATGRSREADLAALERGAGDLDRLGRHYDQFVRLNEPAKQLFTKWQLEDHPRSCIDELARLDADTSSAIADMSTCFARLGCYGPRFALALERVRAGDDDAFTKPMAGSYHDAWMELHHDLLLTLDRSRSTADGY